MADDTKAFAPLYIRNNGATAGTLASSVTVAGTASAVASAVFAGTLTQNNFPQIKISNTAAAWAYVNFGVLDSTRTVTAATVATGLPVAPGTSVIVSVDPEVNAASVILASGTGNVIFTRGLGM